MAIITNAGKTFLTKIYSDSKLISLGLNENGVIRRYEKGELIAEFKNINEYIDWVKQNRPDELCIVNIDE